MKRHDWRDSHCLGPIKVCNRCPEIWWLWTNSPEPASECIPIEDVCLDYAAPQGEVA